MIDLTSLSGLSLVRAVTALPRTPAGLTARERLEFVVEEAALQDFAKTFAHLVNAADLDAVVSRYAANCRVTSPRGEYVGTGEVRRNYERYFDPVRWFSCWTNVAVRFIRPFDDAYVSAYQYSIGVDESQPESQGALSTDVWRVKRVGDEWQIAERRIDILDTHNHRLLRPVVAAAS
jgi:ketosteroid isomerase-like protein